MLKEYSSTERNSQPSNIILSKTNMKEHMKGEQFVLLSCLPLGKIFYLLEAGPYYVAVLSLELMLFSCLPVLRF